MFTFLSPWQQTFCFLPGLLSSNLSSYTPASPYWPISKEDKGVWAKYPQPHPQSPLLPRTHRYIPPYILFLRVLSPPLGSSICLPLPSAIIHPRFPDLTNKNVVHPVRFKFQIITSHFLVLSNLRPHLGHSFAKT